MNEAGSKWQDSMNFLGVDSCVKDD
uniref:Uncharacterized protein n=1 Tax=Arundo donax TaxID=35708 RepID=A0A0A9B9M0_ARUDO